jgi:phage terminase Nu1 subunit (DNA packaging protein)
MTDDDSWLEAPTATTIPVRSLTKRELADATNYTLTHIDKLCRAGLPARPTASRRQGLRFDLPEVIEWLCAHRAATQGGGEGETLAEAKRRIAVAQAEVKELERARLKEEFLPTDLVMKLIGDYYTVFSRRLQNIDSHVFGLTDKQRTELQDATYDLLAEISEGKFAEAMGLDGGESELEFEATGNSAGAIAE